MIPTNFIYLAMRNSLVLCARRKIVLDIFKEDGNVYLAGREYHDCDILYNENGLAKHLCGKITPCSESLDYLTVDISLIFDIAISPAREF